MKFKNPVSVVSPTEGEHATNKDYVDNKQVTISWVEYQALSESEKNNGTVYYIPDMPVSTGGVVANEWKLFKTVTGTTEIDISSLIDKNELLIEVISNHASYKLDYTYIVLPRTLTSANSVRDSGHYISSTDYSACKIAVNTSTARLMKSFATSTEITSSCTVNLYYR